MQGKARLGTVVHKKTATALALTAVKNEDQREFAKLVESFKVGGWLAGAPLRALLLVLPCIAVGQGAGGAAGGEHGEEDCRAGASWLRCGRGLRRLPAHLLAARYCAAC